MTDLLRVLLVEDNADDAALVVRSLERAGHSVSYERVTSADAFVAHLEGREWDVVISDHIVPGFGSEAALRIVRSGHYDLPFIVVSGQIGEEAAVDALKAGADDYVMKDRLARLPPAVARAIAHRALERRQRQHDAEVQRAQAIEALGAIAAGIAHDVNNVLTVIIGNLQLAQMLDAGPRAAEHLEQAYLAAERGRDLVRRTLALGQGGTELRELVRPSIVAEEVASLLRPGLGAGIQLDVEVSADTPDVIADPTQLFQMLMNLASNAAQAIETDHGRVRITLAREPLSESHRPVASLPDGEYLLLQVTDTGKGMDRATAARVFEPFFTTKPRGQGSGLGLAAVHHMVQRHGGAITVRSEPGQGTTFSIYLPVMPGPSPDTHGDEARPADEATVAPRSGAAPGTMPKHVLYVEDDVLVALATSKYLRTLGYVVTEVHSAREGIEAVLNRPDGFDVVLTDERLPGMSGSQMAAALARTRPGLPVIIASGVKPVDGALALPNVLEWLSKPYADLTLRRALERALAGAGVRSPDC